MSLNPLYEEHIREVTVAFDLTAPDLDPDAVSEVVGINPTWSARRGDERRSYTGHLLDPHDEGWWQLSSRDTIDSKDINDHFRYLLTRLLPHEDYICEVGEEGESSFGFLWKSTYLYAGTGPMLARDCVAGVARLNAEIGFDIYQVNEKEEA
jgi:hypothetical protein